MPSDMPEQQTPRVRSDTETSPALDPDRWLLTGHFVQGAPVTVRPVGEDSGRRFD